MYKVSLEQSYFPAQADTPFRASTIADLLHEQAKKWGSRIALREILDNGSIGREWTYGGLLEDSGKVRPGACVSTPARCSHRGVRDELPRVGSAKVGFGPCRIDARDGEPIVSCTRAQICSRTIEIG